MNRGEGHLLKQQVSHPTRIPASFPSLLPWCRHPCSPQKPEAPGQFKTRAPAPAQLPSFHATALLLWHGPGSQRGGPLPCSRKRLQGEICPACPCFNISESPGEEALPCQRPLHPPGVPPRGSLSFLRVPLCRGALCWWIPCSARVLTWSWRPENPCPLPSSPFLSQEVLRGKRRQSSGQASSPEISRGGMKKKRGWGRGWDLS